jgi:hypothetical protein
MRPPPRVGGIVIRSGYGHLQPSRRMLSLTCHLYKFLVNLGQGAVSHKELLSVAGAIFCVRCRSRGASAVIAGTAKVVNHGRAMICEFCLKSDPDAPIEATCSHCQETP